MSNFTFVVLRLGLQQLTINPLNTTEMFVLQTANSNSTVNQRLATLVDLTHLAQIYKIDLNSFAVESHDFKDGYQALFFNSSGTLMAVVRVFFRYIARRRR